MIKGKQKSILSKESILDKISTYDIYRFYQGPFKINEPCVNRHRGESNASLIIGDKVSNTLTHKDFGDYNWRGDCFSFVQQVFNCDFYTALKIIDKDFNLGLSMGKLIDYQPIITWGKPEIEIKKSPLIQVVYYKNITKEGLDYWKKFGQGEQDLKRERIYQPKEIWRNKKKIPIKLLTFAYHYEDIDKWKIYRPFAPKKEKNTPMSLWKWDSNVPFDYVDNIQGIHSSCDRVYMTKSKKDRMVLMTALQTNCIADVQAEDPSCISPEVLDKYLSVQNRYIISDNDKKGKEFSWWLTKKHGFRHVNVPDKYLTEDPKCTDFADLCYHYGIETVINHFKRKKLL